jgi:integrase
MTMRTRGHIAKRPRKGGGFSYLVKVESPNSRPGKRKYVYKTARNKEDAQKALTEILAKIDANTHVDPSKMTVAEFLDDWEKTLTVSPKTAERYRELIRVHIRPHLGDLRLQTLRTTRIESFYADLGKGVAADRKTPVRALAPRTVGHIHRVLFKALSVAERDGLISTNPAAKADRPKVERKEIEILDEQQVRDVLSKLRGRNTPNGQAFYRLVELYLATGMRRGEGVALRWKDVDLDGAKLQVNQSLEQTKKGALRFKAPKTKFGCRTITLPAFVVSGLRAHRTAQALERLALGLGKDADDALVFRHADGSPLPPENITKEWIRLVAQLRLPKVTLHALRHTHASQLIASGMDVLTISRRLGHGSPSITLDVYGHLFQRSDGGAAAVIDKAFGGLQTE